MKRSAAPATITAIRQEALRVFPAQPRVTAVSVGRLPLREGWLCTVRLPGGAELITFALTKQGAMADAYELLRGLRPLAAAPDTRALVRATGAVEGTRLHLELQGVPYVARPMDGCVVQEFPDRPAVIDVDYKHSAGTGELVVGVVRFRPAVSP